jgi:hypothetical protein
VACPPVHISANPIALEKSLFEKKNGKIRMPMITNTLSSPLENSRKITEANGIMQPKSRG